METQKTTGILITFGIIQYYIVLYRIMQYYRVPYIRYNPIYLSPLQFSYIVVKSSENPYGFLCSLFDLQISQVWIVCLSCPVRVMVLVLVTSLVPSRPVLPCPVSLSVCLSVCQYLVLMVSQYIIVYQCIHIYMCIYVYMYICIYILTYIRIYIYICIYTCIYIYVYIYVCIA